MTEVNINDDDFGLDLLSNQVKTLVNILPELIYVLDLEQYRLVFVNNRLTDTLGYNQEEISRTGNIFNSVMVHGNTECFFLDIEQRFKNCLINESIEFTMVFRHKNGENRTLKHTGTILKAENGKNISVMLVAQDITEQMLRQEIRKFKQLTLHDAERVLQYGCWEMRENNNHIVWTDGLFELLGVPKEHFPDGKIPKGFYLDFIPQHEREAVKKLAYSNIDARVPYYEIEHSLIDTKGNMKYVVLRGNVFETNGTVVVMGTVVDNTAKIIADNELNNQIIQLQRQHTQMQEAEAIFKFGSWECDLQEINFRWSEGLFKILELDSSQYLSNVVPPELYKTFIHPEDIDGLHTYTRRSISEGKTFYEFEHRVVDSKGNIKHAMQRARLQYDQNGRLIRAVGVLADLTEIETYKRELERQVDALNKSNQELEQFAYVASHDLQEPLRKIKAFGERLDKKFGDSLGIEGTFFIERMINAAQRMNILIDDLLTYSRASRQIEAPKKISLNEIIANVIDDLEIKIQNENVNLEIGDLPTIEAQPVQMQQLFQNLIENAIKFKKPDTTPHIKISAAKVSQYKLEKIPELNINAEYYEFAVSDNGIGFDSKYAEQIFAIFQRLHGRTEYEGTGLGLAICRKIVEAHKGLIKAQAEENKGATFIFYLPILKTNNY
jgi:PAS domain S-box-containing protein